MSLSAPKNDLVNSLSTYIMFEFEGLDDFLNKSNKISVKISEEIAEKIGDLERKNPEISGVDVFWNELSAAGNFSELSLKTSLMLVHSTFEINLKQICEKFGKHLNKKIELKDMKGKGFVNECKNYLEKVLELDFSDCQTKWDELEPYNRVRNIFAHQGYISIEKNKPIEKCSDYLKIAKIPNVKINQYGYVEFTSITPVKQYRKTTEEILQLILQKLKIS